MIEEIVKGAQFAKILGNFGEYLVCNWLSRSGFEVCIVDHTGMDVIACHPNRKQRLGITVKSRTRIFGKETESVYIFRKAKKDRQKLLAACEVFGCEPWIAIYVECAATANLFLTSLSNYDKKHKSKEGRLIDAWKMTEKQKDEYGGDPEAWHIGIKFNRENWRVRRRR